MGRYFDFSVLGVPNNVPLSHKTFHWSKKDFVFGMKHIKTKNFLRFFMGPRNFFGPSGAHLVISEIDVVSFHWNYFSLQGDTPFDHIGSNMSFNYVGLKTDE